MGSMGMMGAMGETSLQGSYPQRTRTTQGVGDVRLKRRINLVWTGPLATNDGMAYRFNARRIGAAPTMKARSHLRLHA